MVQQIRNSEEVLKFPNSILSSFSILNFAIRPGFRYVEPVRICVVGKGGREHALIRALRESESHPEVFCFPGSEAIHEIEGAGMVAAHDLESLIDWMTANSIDLCVAGEESYLVTEAGLANRCKDVGIPCWGPPFAAAQLEASKEFAKEFMQRHHIPTGDAAGCADIDEAQAAIAGKYPTVLKFDGLAAGKGVAVCPDKETADKFLNEVMVERRFGPGRLLVEECLVGPEISIFAAVSGSDYLILTPARDYKRIGEGDEGPNTGGMGAVASRRLVDPELMKRIDDEIVAPTVAGLEKDELDYVGFLYFGLMLTENGPKIIEYNCRFGDPECQAVMPLISGDLAKFCLEGAKGNLQSELLSFNEGWSVCCILASAGYPESSRSGDPISGLENVEDARIYHAGTKKQDGGWATNGGRVLAIVAGGDSRENAVEKAHAEASKVHFDGSQRRSDIGRLHF
jgi:phosphoribosylamine--glycine ligase